MARPLSNAQCRFVKRNNKLALVVAGVAGVAVVVAVVTVVVFVVDKNNGELAHMAANSSREKRRN